MRPRVEKDPDRRIQEAVALVFQKFGELGTVRQTLSWFLEHGLQLPARSVSGEIAWRRPSFGVLYRMLKSDLRRAYAYGKPRARFGMSRGRRARRLAGRRFTTVGARQNDPGTPRDIRRTPRPVGQRIQLLSFVRGQRYCGSGTSCAHRSPPYRAIRPGSVIYFTYL